MTSRELARAARRFADQQSARIADVPDTKQIVATVSTVSPLTVSWRGQVVTVAGRNGNYTATVGDRVVCDLIDSQLIIAYPVLT